MTDDVRLEESLEFADNPEPRCPCVLVLDTSGSMQDRGKIGALNEGLAAFREALSGDEIASRRVEVAIVTFDDEARVVQDFVTLDKFETPTLKAGGMTAMGAGVETALDIIQARKDQYRQGGVVFYRPWVFLITDGEPQGEHANALENATRRVHEAEEKKRVAFFAVGVEGANMEILQRLAVRTPLRLHGLNFREMFVWLSTSMQSVSRSRTDEQIALPPVGWGSVEQS